MRDDLYVKVHRRIQRRLSGPPRLGTLHALAFTVFTVPMALFTGVFMRWDGVLDVMVFATIVGWSLLLFLHAGYSYLSSGARKRRRERVIQEEVLDAGDSFGLDEDAMIGLHTRLDDAVRAESQVHVRLAANALVNALLWPGLLVLIPFAVIFLRVMDSSYVDVLARFMVALSVLGTFLAAFALPFRALRPSAPSALDEKDNLRAVYGYKRKRALPSRHDEAAERLSIGDDGELIAEPVDESERYDYH